MSYFSAGNCHSAWILWWFFSFFLSFFFFFLLCFPLKFQSSPTDAACERVSYCVESSPSQLPPQDLSPLLNLLSLFIFIFCPISFQRDWFAFLGIWGPPPAYRSCFVEVASCIDDPLCICGGESGLPILLLHHLGTAPQMLSFKPAFSLSSFTFIKRLFSFSSLSAIRVVSSAYLRLLIFLPLILIPVFTNVVVKCWGKGR